MLKIDSSPKKGASTVAISKIGRRLSSPSVQNMVNNKILGMALDTTDVPVHFHLEWDFPMHHVWSPKNKQYSVKYEISVTLDGLIVWYYGSFFHDHHDLCIYQNGLQPLLLQNEQVFADKAYMDSTSAIPFKKSKNGPDLHILREFSLGFYSICDHMLRI